MQISEDKVFRQRQQNLSDISDVDKRALAYQPLVSYVQY